QGHESSHERKRTNKRSGRASDGEGDADEQKLIDLLTSQLFQIDPLEDRDPRLLNDEAVNRLRVTGSPRGRYLQCDVVSPQSQWALRHEPLRAFQRQPGALAGRHRLRIRPVTHRARSDQYDVALRELDPLASAGSLELLRPDRLVWMELGKIERPGHIEEHAAGEDRRQLRGVAPEQSEVAEMRVRRVAAVPGAVGAAGDMTERVDMGARVGRAHDQLRDEAEVDTVVVQQAQVALVPLAARCAVRENG